MTGFVSIILKISAPLLFAVLGALITEYSGVLAVFMEGGISLSAFFCVWFTIVTGSLFAGVSAALVLTPAVLSAAALFTVKTKANPFLTGLSVNLFAAGFIPWASGFFLKKKGGISFEEFLPEMKFLPINNLLPFFAALTMAAVLFLLLRFTPEGFALRYSGEAPGVLTASGKNPDKYKIASWAAAGFFSACAGCVLVLRLGAYTSGISAGRGWTALAAVFLGRKNPLLCVLAVIVFSSAEYATNIAQGAVKIPAGILLSFPYFFALIFFIFSSYKNR